MASVEAVISALPRLHHKRSGGPGENAQGKGDRQHGVAFGNEAGDEDGGDEQGQGNRQVVEHHVQVLGLPEGGAR